jgi:hypothetical protein
VAVEACVDDSRQCFAVDGSRRRFIGLLPNSDRVLSDRAGRQTFADRIRLSPTSIVPDDGNAFGCHFAYSVHNTNGGAFVVPNMPPRSGLAASVALAISVGCN